jgi:hypothetical protein
VTAELEEVEKQMAELDRRRRALSTTLQGLSWLTGANTELPSGTDPFVETLASTTTLEAAVTALRRSGRRNDAGAGEIMGMIREYLHREVNYQTLYKALVRVSTRPDGDVYKSGDKFGLREWKKEEEANAKPTSK